jgi:hypothetical protein
MKNTIKLLVVLLIVFTFNSCDDVTDLADVTFTTTLSENFDVSISETQESISNQVILNLDNSDTHDYLTKLKSVNINKLTYKFTNYTGNESCNMEVEISTDGNVFETKEFQIKQAVDNGTIYEITDVAKLNEMATALKNNNQVSFGMEGAVFDGPADFIVEVTAEVTVVANPL